MDRPSNGWGRSRGASGGPAARKELVGALQFPIPCAKNRTKSTRAKRRGWRTHLRRKQGRGRRGDGAVLGMAEDNSGEIRNSRFTKLGFVWLARMWKRGCRVGKGLYWAWLCAFWQGNPEGFRFPTDRCRGPARLRTRKKRRPLTCGARASGRERGAGPDCQWQQAGRGGRAPGLGLVNWAADWAETGGEKGKGERGAGPGRPGGQLGWLGFFSFFIFFTIFFS